MIDNEYVEYRCSACKKEVKNTVVKLYFSPFYIVSNHVHCMFLPPYYNICFIPFLIVILKSSEYHFFPSHTFGILNFFFGETKFNACIIFCTSISAGILTSKSSLYSNLFSIANSIFYFLLLYKTLLSKIYCNLYLQTLYTCHTRHHLNLIQYLSTSDLLF